eukprot:snap_masked-scaffold_69-processed-gene-0.31-mRNA-1 protein AED:1.00 eAED:1.00 QI:0/0/0/0/1/1/2/0/73
MFSLSESIKNRLFWYSETSVTIKFFDGVTNLFSLLSTIRKISIAANHRECLKKILYVPKLFIQVKEKSLKTVL